MKKPETLTTRLARGIVLAVPLIIGANWLFEKAPSQIWLRWEVLTAVALLVGAVLYMISYPIARWLLEAFGIIEKDSSSPMLSCRTAEWLVKKRRYREAIKEYERIIKKYPENLKAHQGLLHILRELAPNPVHANNAYQRARKYFNKPSDREKLRPANEKISV